MTFPDSEDARRDCYARGADPWQDYKAAVLGYLLKYLPGGATVREIKTIRALTAKGVAEAFIAGTPPHAAADAIDAVLGRD